MILLPQNTALVLIDLQKAIDHPSWGERNNLQAEENVGRLLAHWRRTSSPIVHIRHVSRFPAMSLANLDGEYASIRTTGEVLKSAGG